MAATGVEQPGFLREKHIGYFAYSLQCLPSAYESQDVNRLTLTYFCVAGLDLLDSLDQVDTGSIVDWVYSLQVLPGQSQETDTTTSMEAGASSTKSGSSSTKSGSSPTKSGSSLTKAGFRGSPWIGIEHSEDGAPLLHQYDGATLAMTYSALATLATLGALDLNRLNKGGILLALAALQQPNGSFLASQESGEDDVRFAFCAAAICTFLGGCGDVDVGKAVAFLRSCQVVPLTALLLLSSSSNACALPPMALHLQQPHLLSTLRDSSRD